MNTSDGFITCTSFSWWGQVWWKWHTVLVCVLWSWHLLWHAPLIISPSHSQGSDRQPLQQPDHSVRFDQFYFTYQDVMSISENVRLFFCYVPLYIVINLAQLSESAHFFIINSTRISCQLRTAISTTWPIIRSGGTCRDIWYLSTIADKWLLIIQILLRKAVIFLLIALKILIVNNIWLVCSNSHIVITEFGRLGSLIGRLQWMSSNCYYRTHTTSSLSWSITWLIFTSSFLCYVHHWPAVHCSAPVQCNPCTT